MSEIDTSKLVTWKQIGETLDFFHVDVSLETLRPVAKRLGLKPVRQEPHPESGRGRVSLYDPIVCWVLATVHHWPRSLGEEPHT